MGSKFVLVISRNQKRIGNLRLKLERADEKAKGNVTMGQLRRILMDFGIDEDVLGDEEVDILEDHYDKRRMGVIYYMDLCDDLEDVESRLESDEDYKLHRPSKHGGRGGFEEEESKGSNEANETLNALKRLLHKAMDRGIDILECFEHFDERGTGYIDRSEFKSGMNRIGIPLSAEEVDQVMSLFKSSKRSGQINYTDF